MRRAAFAASLALALFAIPALAAHVDGPLPAPTPPIIEGAYPYVAIPGAARAPDPSRTYKVVYNVHSGARDAASTLAGVQMAATFVSALRGQGVPADHIQVALVFHDDAVDGILNDAAYEAKFHRPNPNLPLLSGLKANGARLFICGQYMVVNHVAPESLADEVTVASEAFITIVSFENDGYALLDF